MRLALEVQSGFGSAELDFVNQKLAAVAFGFDDGFTVLLLGSLHRGSGLKTLARGFVNESYLRSVKADLVVTALDFHGSEDRWRIESDVITL